MKKIAICIGFILLVSEIFFAQALAQDLADTFKTFIPQAAISGDTTKRQISARLTQLGEIHPDLIYHYFEFLNVQFTQPRSSQALISYRRFNTIKGHYLLRRHEWAKKQIKDLSKQQGPLEIIQLAQRHLEELSIEPEHRKPDEQQDLAIETNKLNYLAIQYYQWDQKINYIAGKDYLSERQAIEEKLRAEFVRKMSGLSSIHRLSHHKLISEFLRYWHLYENQPFGDQDPTFASAFVLAIEKHYYSLHDVPNDLIKPPRLAIAGGLYQNQVYQFTNRIPIVELNREFLLRKPTKFSQKMFSIQSRWPLRKYLTAFSYLNFQLAYLNSGGRQRFTFNNYIERFWSIQDTTTKIKTFYQEITQFKKGKINIHLQESYWGKLQTPIIIINKHVWLEAGVLITQNRIAYQVHYNYLYKLIETKYFPNGNQRTTVLKDGESGNRSQNKTLKHWFVTPSLACVIQLPYRLTLEADLFEKYATVMAALTLF
ncbi:MAG: hypothetical protein ONB46_09435 [candidate division KSB1 bacterium]|nr:hypothetical protein [candidate division KSB1 bacterium]MDZ7366024.1 hypothetical protein [candidate division KSB1 bacterium]MDZ7404141.1 hypothetical protein [candidate division KSB1 bacterium]